MTQKWTLVTNLITIGK